MFFDFIFFLVQYSVFPGVDCIVFFNCLVFSETTIYSVSKPFARSVVFLNIVKYIREFISAFLFLWGLPSVCL